MWEPPARIHGWSVAHGIERYRFALPFVVWNFTSPNSGRCYPWPSNVRAHPTPDTTLVTGSYRRALREGHQQTAKQARFQHAFLGRQFPAWIRFTARPKSCAGAESANNRGNERSHEPRHPGAARGLGLLRVSRAAGGDHRACRQRRRRAGPDAHRRRQIALLPVSRAGARRHGRGGLAAHRADAGPGRRAARGSACARRSSTPRSIRPKQQRVEQAVSRRRARHALRRARAPADASASSSCWIAQPASRCSPSTKPTASRSGATTSARNTCQLVACCTSADPTSRASRSPRPPTPPRGAKSSNA